MLNFGQLQQYVQHNCHISDARHAGNYTMCTFLLKMREYYRWEHDIPLSSGLAKDEIGQWLVAREQSWESIEDQDYQQIVLADIGADPFDDATINERLIKQGYVYSSGIGIFNKPHFFLGQLSRHETHGDVNIYVSSCEYARDLVAPPAMSRDNTVYIRMESLRRSIWERIEEWQWNREHDTPLYHAVRSYGVDLLKQPLLAEDIEQLLDKITLDQIDTLIQHELGEVEAGKLLGQSWKDRVLSLSGNKAELVARAIRDHLADCLATLPGMLEDKHPGRLQYYFANFAGIRRALWPELLVAYRADNALAEIERQVKMGAKRWQEHAERLLDGSVNDAMSYIDKQFGDSLNH